MKGYILTNRPSYLAALQSLGDLWEVGSQSFGWFPLANAAYQVR